MGTPGKPLFAVAILLSLCLAPAPSSGAAASPPPPEAMLDLAGFEGHYAYRDGTTLFMVRSPKGMVAVIGDAKYALRPAGTDAFSNGNGDPVRFTRDAEGRVVAFTEGSDSFPRLSTTVPATTRQLLVPRPPGPDGQPPDYRYAPPLPFKDGIRTGSAGPATLPATVAERLVKGVVDGTYADVHSILIHHKGALRVEEYFYGCDPSRWHEMRSLTKSVIALLAGAAVDRKLLRMDQPVLLALGQDATGSADAAKGKVTLADLLANRSGLACDDYDRASPGNEVRLYESEDWVRAFTDLPMVAEPGTLGRYCSGGFLAAGRAIEVAAGKPLPGFAQDALFAPLGIRPGDWAWEFVLDRSRRNDFGQIRLRPRDMLKLGLLIKDRGEWSGRRVLPASWIDAVVSRQSRIGDSDYGLGVWHRWYRVPAAAGEQRVDTIMLSGNGGQKVFIVPSLDLVVVFTGGTFNADSPQNEMMAGVILPALLASTP